LRWRGHQPLAIPLLDRKHDLSVEQLVVETGGKAFHSAVLLGYDWLDVGRLRADDGDPVPHGPDRDFGPRVDPDERRRPSSMARPVSASTILVDFGLLPDQIMSASPVKGLRATVRGPMAGKGGLLRLR